MTDSHQWFHSAIVVILYGSIIVLAVPTLAATLYLTILTALSGKTGAPAVDSSPKLPLKFDIVVPAHNESLGIVAVVQNLRAVDWPTSQFRILVVADNCTDDTADRAAAAGAYVLVRNNLLLRGKGHALRYGFDVCQADGWADALVVIDADSRVSTSLLQTFASRLQQGAAAVQVHHGVLDPCQSRRIRLLSIGIAAFHRVRSRARERLGVSCGIRGNGWCVSAAVERAVPFTAYGLTEDVEYGIRLGLAGYRVHYADEAEVLASLVTDAAGAISQRQRWEGGRKRLLREFLPALMAWNPRGTRKIRFDLAADLLVPPLAAVFIAIALLSILAFTGYVATMAPEQGMHFLFLGTLSVFMSLLLLMHVLRGWSLSETGWTGLLDLLLAPRFIWWKLKLALKPNSAAEWVRTRRVPP